MLPVARIEEVSHRVLPWLTGLLLAVAHLGMAPVNVVLGLGIALVLPRLTRDRAVRFVRDHRLWLAGIALYLAARFLAAINSPDPSVSLRFLAKDWRLLVLIWSVAALGGVVRHRLSILVVVQVLSILTGVADFLGGAHLIEFWRPAKPAAVTQTDALHSLTMTLGGVAMLTSLAPAVLGSPRRVSAAVIAGSLVLLVFSGVRSAWLGCLAGWSVLALLRPKLRLPMVGLLVITLTAASLLPAARARIKQTLVQAEQVEINFGSIGRRLELWNGAWQMGQTALFGVGPGRFTAEIDPYLERRKGEKSHAHSVPLHLFAETGAPGLAAWLLLLALTIRALWRQPAMQRDAGLGLITMLVVSGLFEVNWYDAEVLTVFLLLLGICLGRRGADPPAEPGKQSDDFDRQLTPSTVAEST